MGNTQKAVTTNKYLRIFNAVSTQQQPVSLKLTTAQHKIVFTVQWM